MILFGHKNDSIFTFLLAIRHIWRFGYQSGAVSISLPVPVCAVL
uniref:Uncharacterized protein n=1 Tax=Anguilla anguilla TaxID=7936 RepID=A0A0E9VAP2_ANGAN